MIMAVNEQQKPLYDIDTDVLSSLYVMTNAEFRIADRTLPKATVIAKINTELRFLREMGQVFMRRLQYLATHDRL